ncbi:MAG: protein tyrosine phosphatase [Beijerinckiaceae bacterium]|nr:protein tyrosine phosphatase [Beijerinckiaceae bacterium]MCZ8298835.1 protein tyrosine phosphatase [Beijerinckiaceae bacterium]
MPVIHVCAWRLLNRKVAETGATGVVTLIKNIGQVERPPGIAPERHLKLDFADITEPREGEVMPGSEHVEQLLGYFEAWDRSAPLVVHCYAGVSRSTAGAFIAACQLRPDRDEAEWASEIRRLSPTATPNARLVALADAALGRNGRMIRALTTIGRGEDCFDGVPFALDLSHRQP